MNKDHFDVNFWEYIPFGQDALAPLQVNREHLIVNGWCISVQASQDHYCEPRTNMKPIRAYKLVEVAIWDHELIESFHAANPDGGFFANWNMPAWINPEDDPILQDVFANSNGHYYWEGDEEFQDHRNYRGVGGHVPLYLVKELIDVCRKRDINGERVPKRFRIKNPLRGIKR